MWEKTWNYSGHDEYEPQIAVAPAGNAFVSGSILNGANPAGMATMKYTPTGTLAWQYVYGTWKRSADIVLGPAGALYVTGRTWPVNGPSPTNYWTVKFRQSPAP